jgi:hypothetical protein
MERERLATAGRGMRRFDLDDNSVPAYATTERCNCRNFRAAKHRHLRLILASASNADSSPVSSGIRPFTLMLDPNFTLDFPKALTAAR